MNNQNQLQQQSLPRQKPVVITSGDSNLNYERVVKFGNVFPKSPKGILPGIYGFYGSSKNGVENYEPINEYGFLSNQITLDKPILFDGLAYYSIEAFYYAMKTSDKDKRRKIAQLNIKQSSAAVKSIGKTIPEKPDWYIQKWAVLLYALRDKFSQTRYRQLLLNTENLYIEETNWWGDQYYGVDLKSGLGFNIFGYILMHIRNEIRNNLDPKQNPFRYYFDPYNNTLNQGQYPESITTLII